MLAILVATAVVGGPAADQTVRPSPDRIREAARQAVAGDVVQTEMPGAETQPWSNLEGPSRPARGRDRSGSRPVETTPVSGFAQLVPFLFWGGVLAVIALVSVWAVTEILSMQRGRKGPAGRDGATDPGATTTDPSVRSLVDRSARLAASGRIGEATRELLRACLAQLAGRGVVSLTSATTSREVLRQVGDQREARRSLAVLVTAVEHSAFGGLELGPDDYSRCRDAALTFLAPAGDRSS